MYPKCRPPSRNTLSSQRAATAEHAPAPAGDFGSLLFISPPAESKPAQATQAGGLDIAKLMKIQSIMQSASKPDKNIQLLLALRPLLKEENQAKIDRLIKIFKLFAVYPALKESGLLGGDLLGLF